MLQTGVLLLAEGTINTLITSDEVTTASLAKLTGKVFEFSITDAPVHIFILPHNQGIQIQQSFDGIADSTFTGSLSHFQQLATSNDKSSQLFGNGIDISGDSQLATQLQRIIANAEIDWQGLIASVTGDLFASQVSAIFKSTSQQLGLTKESLTLNTVEYLQEELGTLPAPAEVEGFIDDIAELNQTSQRLAARMALLENMIQTKKSD